MARLIVKRDLLDRDLEEYEIPTGTILAEWLMANLPKPEGTVRLFKNSVAAETEIAIDDAVTCRAEEHDIFILIHAPAEFGTVLLVSLFVAAVGIAVLLRPELPPSPNEFEDDVRSPNNLITGQTNVLRPGARIPDILGQVRAWPDLITPSYSVWTGQHQDVTELFCLGVGEYSLTGSRLGDTYISHIPKATVSFYDLRGIPRPATVLSVVESPQVQDVALLDDSEVEDTLATINITAGSPVVQVANTTVLLSGGDYFSILDDPAGDSTANAGYYLIESVAVAAPWFNYTVAEPNPITTTQNGLTLTYRSHRAESQGWVRLYQVNPLGNVGRLWAEANSAIDLGLVEVFQQTGAGPVFFQDFKDEGSSGLDTSSYFPTAPNGYILTFASLVYGTGGSYAVLDFEHVDGTTVDWTASPVWGAGVPPFGSILMTRFTSAQDQGWSTWTVTPSEDPDELWIDIALPRGLYQQNAGEPKASHSVEATVEIQGLSDSDTFTPVGTVYSEVFPYNMNSVNKVRFTNKFKLQEIIDGNSERGDNFSGGSKKKNYQVRVQRSDVRDFSDANRLIVDDMEWASLRSVKEILAPNFGDVTLIELRINGSAQVAELEDRTFNVIAKRKLPALYRSGIPDGPPWIATQQWVEGFIYRALAADGGNFAIEDIDVEGIYQTAAVVSGSDGFEGGHMSLTLDRFEDVNKELARLASVLRCTAYRVGEKLHVVRDHESIGEAVALYNRRNKAPKAERLELEFSGKESYDGIEMEFQDSANDWKTITFVYPDDSLRTNLKRIKGTGLTHWSQAWRRAYYEWQLYLRRKDTLTLEVLEDPRVLSPLDRIKNVDNLDVRGLTDGEVLNFDLINLEVELDKDVVFESGETYTIWLRGDRVDGFQAIESFTATTGGVSNVVIISSTPSAITVVGRDNLSEGMGSLYSFAADSSDRAQDYLIMGYELTDEGFTNLTCTKYDPVVYDGDLATLPSPPDPPE